MAIKSKLPFTLILTFTVLAGWALAGTPVVIPDSNLYNALFDELGEAPTETNMATLTYLYADGSSYSISDLTGLEYAVNLTELDLSGQNISDYSPISSLTQLEFLYLGDNFNLSDLSFLSGLNLYGLVVYYCSLSDLTPLSGMTNLYYIDASGNSISDLSPLAGLFNLLEIYLFDNDVTDLSPLAGLSNLNYFYASSNHISSFSSLAGLPNLMEVYLDYNEITDISPAADISNWANLNLDGNQIEDLSALKDDTDLPYISLYDNPINAASYCYFLPIIESNNYSGVIDLDGFLGDCDDPANIPDATLKSAIETELGIVDPTINEMAQLQYLYVNSSGINDLTGLELAVNLLELDLSSNNIMDIGPLQYLRELEYLDLELNNLDQDAFCVVLPMLQANNPALIDGVTLFTDTNPYTCPTTGHFIPDDNLRALVQSELGLGSEPTQLDMLNLFSLYASFTGGPESSKVTDLTGLEYATNLYLLDLSDHNITSVSPLAGLPLNGLYLSGNNINSIAPLSGMTNLEFFYLTFNSNLSDISAVSTMSSLRFFGCGWCNIAGVAPVAGLSQLEELQIDYNPIGDITPIYGLTNLTRLGLAGLGLTDIAFLSTWPNMTFLSLSSNPALTDLSSLSQFTSLTSLYFYSMSVSDISFMSALVNLERLGFANNQVQDISAIAGLTALKSLYIYNNQINDISPLTALTNLEFVYIYSNPLNPPAYCVHAPAIQANNTNLALFNYGSNTNPLSSDCTTDATDLAVVTSEWGATDCAPANNWCNGADFNRDGKVNIIDYAYLGAIWLAIP